MMRALAILLAVFGLFASAAEAQPRRGGWGMGGGRAFMAGPRFGGGRFGAGRFGGRFGGGRFGRRFGGMGRFGYGPYGPAGYGLGAAPGFYRPAIPPPQPPPAVVGRPFGGMDGGWRQEQNSVRQAVREGRHIPLNQAIENVRRQAPGRELDAGLEQGPDGRAVYRLRWAGQGGRRQDYLVDAGTGQVLGVQNGGAPEGAAVGGP